MTTQKSFLIIGGGIVGLATAYRLMQRYPYAKITLLEKENTVGNHQSTHNSGVLHAGLYYAPGSAKAALAVRGIRQMTEFCRAEKISHEICGKLVVAVSDDEIPRLEELLRRGLANGLTGLKKLTGTELNMYEPYANGIAAIHVPEEGIVDYRQVCDHLALIIQNHGVKIITNAPVKGLVFLNSAWIAKTATSEYQAGFLINCAGLYCDKIAKLANLRPPLTIMPFRGEYYELKKSAQHLVKNLIYPVPNPEFPFLGVHFTRMIQGGIEAGPNAVLAFAREGYRLGNINLKELAEALSYPGLWRFLYRYPDVVTSELICSLSKTLFCRALQRLVPDIKSEDLVPGQTGVRAQAMNLQGELLNDFHLDISNNAIHLLNAPSPAATASLAIGEYIVNQITL